jgi:non-ribosomal peptide synthase protein (TIGR01720 family)
LRAVWLRRGAGEDLLLLVVHHLAVDAVSWRILLADLAQACQDTTPLPPVGTTLRSWALRLAELSTDPDIVADRARWDGVLSTPRLTIADRPLDPATDLNSTAGRLMTTVPAALAGDEPQEVLLAALAWAIAQWRPEDGGAVVVEVERHGRDEDLLPGADLSRTIGWFTSTHPVRVELPAADRAAAHAGRLFNLVKEQLRALPARRGGYGLLRYLNPVGDPLPAPEIAVNYLGRFTGAARGGGVFTPVAGFDTGSDQDPSAPLTHLLEFSALIDETGDAPVLTASWVWASGALPAERVEALAALWVRALEAFADRDVSLNPADVAASAISQDEIDEFELDDDLAT